MSDLILFLLTVVFTLIGSIAAIQLKGASKTDKLREIPLKPSLYFGAFLYMLAALLNIVVLTYWEYTLVLPLTSITYVWTAILAKIIYKENLSYLKVLGLGLVVIGSILII